MNSQFPYKMKSLSVVNKNPILPSISKTTEIQESFDMKTERDDNITEVNEEQFSRIAELADNKHKRNKEESENVERLKKVFNSKVKYPKCIFHYALIKSGPEVLDFLYHHDIKCPNKPNAFVVAGIAENIPALEWIYKHKKIAGVSNNATKFMIERGKWESLIWMLKHDFPISSIKSFKHMLKHAPIDILMQIGFDYLFEYTSNDIVYAYALARDTHDLANVFHENKYPIPSGVYLVISPVTVEKLDWLIEHKCKPPKQFINYCIRSDTTSSVFEWLNDENKNKYIKIHKPMQMVIDLITQL